VNRVRYASLLDDPAFVNQLDSLEALGPPAEERYAEWVVNPAPSPTVIRRDAAWLGVVGFVMMVGLGGAAAAYVFADRVALLVARL